MTVHSQETPTISREDGEEGVHHENEGSFPLVTVAADGAQATAAPQKVNTVFSLSPFTLLLHTHTHTHTHSDFHYLPIVYIH